MSEQKTETVMSPDRQKRGLVFLESAAAALEHVRTTQGVVVFLCEIFAEMGLQGYTYSETHYLINVSNAKQEATEKHETH